MPLLLLPLTPYPYPNPTTYPSQGQPTVLVPKEAFGAVTLAKTYRFSLTVTALLPAIDLDARPHPHTHPFSSPSPSPNTLASTLTR